MEQNAAQGLVVDRGGRGWIGPAASVLYHVAVLVTMSVVAVTTIAGARGGDRDVVRAKRFVVLDADGREVGVLGVPDQGDAREAAVVLTLRDDAGRERVRLDASSGMFGSGLYLYDGKVVRGQLAVMPELGARLNLRDPGGTNRISFDVFPTDGPFLTVSGADGKAVWEAPK